VAGAPAAAAGAESAQQGGTPSDWGSKPSSAVAVGGWGLSESRRQFVARTRRQLLLYVKVSSSLKIMQAGVVTNMGTTGNARMWLAAFRTHTLPAFIACSHVDYIPACSLAYLLPNVSVRLLACLLRASPAAVPGPGRSWPRQRVALPACLLACLVASLPA
jgi:hypothetical protein